MVRESKKEDKPKESEFKKFIKKRAPIYLGVIALVIVFVIPELTKGDLQSSFPENLTDQEKEVLDTLMSYKGPNEKGLSILDAISNKISEEYPNEKIYDNKKTKVSLLIDELKLENYHIILNFQSYKGELNYDWNVNMETKTIKGNNPEAKHVIDLVDFYD
ncbi:MAG: hypothetical protein OEL69_00155 [Nitrosopumilus sp.]|nr:hypothetical protein [Nitrosopumilus sp.]